MTNPQTVQTMMVNGQLMQVITPTNQITTQPTVVTTGNITASQPQMMIVQNPNTQQVVQQAVVQSTPTIVGQNDLPPSYQVVDYSYKHFKIDVFIKKYHTTIFYNQSEPRAKIINLEYFL